MNPTPEWITAIATAVSSGAIILLWFQTSLLKEQGRTALAQLDLLKQEITADHERSRRQNAIALLQHWTVQLNRELSSARKLVERLDAAQCRDLFAGKSIKVKLSKIG